MTPMPIDYAGPEAQRRLWQRIATRLAFLIAGVATACWASLVPFARARLAIDDATLGLLLLCLGAGSIVAMPLAGMLTGRLGCRTVIVSAAIMVAASLPLLAVASGLATMSAALLLFGASLGSLDVSMNVQAIRVEREAGSPMMSGFHGLYSAGGIVGAGGMSLLLPGFGPLGSVLAIAVPLLALLALAIPHLRPDRESAASSTLPVLPRGPAVRGPVIAIGLLCMACFLAEGAMVDWSALLLSLPGRLDASRSALGFAAFSATMTFGRFGGDALVRRLGGRFVLVAGSLAASAGVLLAALAPSWPGALAGMAFAGAGSANLVPLLIGAAGRTGVGESAAVAAVSTLGYAGILAGPALLGFVAHGFGLPAAFVLVSLLLLTVPFGSRMLAAMPTAVIVPAKESSP